MAYTEEVLINLVADMSAIRNALKDIENKIITIKFDADTQSIFRDIQKDVRNVESAVNRIDFSNVSKQLSQEIQQGTKSGVKKAKNMDQLSGQLEQVEQTAQSAHTALKEVSSVQLDASSSAQIREITESMKQLVQASQEMRTALNHVLPSSFHEDQIKQTTSQLSDVSDKIRVENNKIEQAYKERGKIYEKAQDIADRVNEKSSPERLAVNYANKHFGEQIKTGSKNEEKYNQGVFLLEQYTQLGGKIEDLKISGLTSDSAIVTQAKEAVAARTQELNVLKNRQTVLEQELSLQKSMLQAARDRENVSDQSKARNTRKNKHALSEDEYLNVSDKALENAKQFFAENNYSHVDLATQHLSSGLAKVSAYIQDVEGDWKKFEATISSSGDLINSKFKDIGKNENLDKKLLSENKDAVKLTIEEQKQQITSLMSQLGLEDKEKWSIEVDDKGFVTIKNNLDSVGDSAIQAVQKFENMEAALSGFNKEAMSSRLSLQNQGEQPDVAEKGTKAAERAQKQAERELEQARKKQEREAEKVRKQQERETAQANRAAEKAQKDIDTQYRKKLDRADKITALQDSKELLKHTNKLNEAYQQWNSIGKAGNMGISVTDMQKAQEELDQLISKYKQFQQVQQTYDADIKKWEDGGKTTPKPRMGDTDFSDDDLSRLIRKYEEWDAASKKVANSISMLKTSYKGVVSSEKALTASNNMKKWLENNERAVKDYGEAIEDLSVRMRNVRTQADYDSLQQQFKSLTTDAEIKGKTGNTLFGNLTKRLKQVSEIFGSYQFADAVQDIGRQMFTESHKVDDALTQLRMATGITNTDAKELMTTYSEMGNELKSLGTDVAASSTEWLNFLGHVKFF